MSCLAVLALAGCSDGPAGPEDDVLLGQFGIADQPTELLATHSGVDVDFGCASFFVSDEPALLDAAGNFSVEGEFRFAGAFVGGPADATLSGRLDREPLIDTVTITFLIDGNGTLDPLVLTLRRGERYEGLPLPCPA